MARERGERMDYSQLDDLTSFAGKTPKVKQEGMRQSLYQTRQVRRKATMITIGFHNQMWEGDLLNY